MKAALQGLGIRVSTLGNPLPVNGLGLEAGKLMELELRIFLFPKTSLTSSMPASRHFSLHNRLSSARILQLRQV